MSLTLDNIVTIVKYERNIWIYITDIFFKFQNSASSKWKLEFDGVYTDLAAKS